MSLCPDQNSSTYESILLNLAHCYRKMKDFEKSIELYEKCLTISPNKAQTLVAIGFSFHQLGEFEKALDYYHRAHFLKNDDSMIESLVKRALEENLECPMMDL